MPSKVVQLKKRVVPQQAERWDGCAMPHQPLAGREANVTMLFPERSRVAEAPPDEAKLFEFFRVQNEILRHYAVELALQIQELKEGLQ